MPGVNRHPHVELGRGMMREVQEGRARAQLSSPGEGEKREGRQLQGCKQPGQLAHSGQGRNSFRKK